MLHRHRFFVSLLLGPGEYLRLEGGDVRQCCSCGAQCNYTLTEMELRHYLKLQDPNLLLFQMFIFYMIPTLTYVNISVPVNPSAVLQRILQCVVPRKMSSLYQTAVFII
jgi:hypothetical protein